jgi:hypothetical protein
MVVVASIMFAEPKQSTGTVIMSHAGRACRVSQTTRRVLVLVGGLCVMSLVLRTCFSDMVKTTNHGDISREREIQIRIERMPYVCAIYMLFLPTNNISNVRLLDMKIDVFDKRDCLVLSDVVKGKQIYEEAWIHNRYPDGKVLVYRLFENKRNIRFQKEYKIQLKLSGDQTGHDFERIDVSSECYY